MHELLRKEELLLITSCNWTKDELLERFSSHFKLFDQIKYPSFRFGGKEGSRVTSLIFKKKKSAIAFQYND